jgi:hypothetical protein
MTEDDTAARGAAPVAIGAHVRAEQRPKRRSAAAATAATTAAAAAPRCASGSCRRAHSESRIGRHPLWKRRVPFGPAAVGVARGLGAWHVL